MRMLFSVGFHENMELRERFDDRVDYKMLNNCSSVDLEAHVKRRKKYKEGSEGGQCSSTHFLSRL